MATINWAGYTWDIVPTGPSWGHEWSDSANNVWVDVQGRLHLKITYVNGIWYCAEIDMQDVLGYGTYEFTIVNNPYLLDDNTVAGFFYYKDDLNELDIEFSRWEAPTPSNNVDYSVQGNPGHDSGVIYKLNTVNTTHRMIWSADKVRFESSVAGVGPWEYNKPLTQTGSVYCINLWLYGDSQTPKNGQEQEIILSGFSFSPETNPSSTKWNCSGPPSYSCTEDPTGIYDSLAACQSICKGSIDMTYTPSQIRDTITPYLIPANCINLNDPMKNAQTGGAVSIYEMPTTPKAYVFVSSAAIDCDGQYSSLCSNDPTNLSDTSFHQSNGQPLNPVVLPWYVLPETPNPIFDYVTKNISGGQVGLVLYNNLMEFGIFGDERGRDVGNEAGTSIGEVSYAMAVSLGIDPDPNTGGVDDNVMYIIFTSSANVANPIENHNSAVTVGTSALDILMSQLGGTPPTKYSCSGYPNYICSANPSGTYNSLVECQAGCQAPPPIKYKCSGSPNYICTEDPLGTFDSMALCQVSCVSNPPPQKWKCSGSPSYTCVQASDGTFNTQADCIASCQANPPPPKPDNTVLLLAAVTIGIYFITKK